MCWNNVPTNPFTKFTYMKKEYDYSDDVKRSLRAEARLKRAKERGLSLPWEKDTTTSTESPSPPEDGSTTEFTQRKT